MGPMGPYGQQPPHASCCRKVLSTGDTVAFGCLSLPVGLWHCQASVCMASCSCRSQQVLMSVCLGLDSPTFTHRVV